MPLCCGAMIDCWQCVGWRSFDRCRRRSLRRRYFHATQVAGRTDVVRISAADRDTVCRARVVDEVDLFFSLDGVAEVGHGGIDAT